MIVLYVWVTPVLFFIFSLVHTEDCRVRSTCKECIETRGCSWCSKIITPRITVGSVADTLAKRLVNFEPSDTRSDYRKTMCNYNKVKEEHERIRTGCFPQEDVLHFCQEDYVDDPSSKITVLKDDPLRGSLHRDPIQIRPQHLYLKLRTGEKATIDISFRKAEDYPIDLYYLMDFSSSMSKYKRSLSQLGDKLIQTMKNVTSNFQLGFGSFVDKVTLPYTDIIPSHLEKPCSKCTSPYSFKNHMALSRETKYFSTKVRDAKMSGNNDTPEGVLDALLQAMVCRKQINWREKARHILVLSTDAPFHLAGDGKLGGIVKPHDGECYVDENGDYTHSLEFDYPSISQIHQKAYENNVNIIFAVLHKVKEEYSALSKAIHGASVGLLDRGENIAEIIKSHYEKLSTTVHLVDNAKGSVYISYSGICPKHKARADETWFDTNECSGVRTGEIIHFQAHITSLDCSDKDLVKQMITIKPIGINESLTIELETICDCDCSDISYPGNEYKSDKCSGVGNLVCGQCVCPKGKVGERCECTGDDLKDVTSTKSCISPNSTNLICSGHGECVCGVCQCNKRGNPNEQITGQYCECDNYSCDKMDGLTCSGHGSCNCKKCSCHSGWSGESCDCPTDEKLCIEENHEEVCSGRGKCFCGKCFCHNGTIHDENRYTGKYCQICMTCGNQCELYNDCVECLSYQSGLYSETKCLNCMPKFNFLNFTHDAKGLHENLTSSNLCISADQAGCSFKYVYYYNEDENLIVWAEREKACSKEINLLAIITGTTGGTVLAGLLLLLVWKLLTTIHDKREYEKFERERQLARWGRGENPLYKTAIQTYRNPTYQRTE